MLPKHCEQLPHSFVYVLFCTFIQYILCNKKNDLQLQCSHAITISQSICLINRVLTGIRRTGDQHFLCINSAVKTLKATEVPRIRCVMQFSHLCGLESSTYTLGYGTSCIWGTKYVNMRTSRALKHAKCPELNQFPTKVWITVDLPST